MSLAPKPSTSSSRAVRVEGRRRLSECRTGARRSRSVSSLRARSGWGDRITFVRSCHSPCYDDKGRTGTTRSPTHPCTDPAVGKTGSVRVFGEAQGHGVHPGKGRRGCPACGFVWDNRPPPGAWVGVGLDRLGERRGTPSSVVQPRVRYRSLPRRTSPRDPSVLPSERKGRCTDVVGHWLSLWCRPLPPYLLGGVVGATSLVE